MGEGRGEGKTTAPLSDGLNAVPDNRLKTYNGTTYYYYYDLGNLIHRELADGEVQNYFYDLHDQLVKAEIFKKDGTKETWAYSYDALGRRIGKGRLKNEEVSDGLEEETGFVWDGSHLLQEVRPDGRYTYIYTDPDSYEPLAQVRNRTNREGESKQEINYFHCDQIGIPREMTDKDGNLLWFGDYYGWGKLKSETNVTGTTHQPFRLQNQYCDLETGLHYNFLRYYEPSSGRFINQDPIKLFGDANLYFFATNSQIWIDPYGLWSLLKPSGMGHHLFPRSIAKKLGIPELSKNNSISWYPNEIKDSDKLHARCHQCLKDEGIPFHGSKFEGTEEDAFDKMIKAYDGITEKGFLKIPGTDKVIKADVTPKEAIEYIRNTYLPEQRKKNNKPKNGC